MQGLLARRGYLLRTRANCKDLTTYIRLNRHIEEWTVSESYLAFLQIQEHHSSVGLTIKAAASLDLVRTSQRWKDFSRDVIGWEKRQSSYAPWQFKTSRRLQNSGWNATPYSRRSYSRKYPLLATKRHMWWNLEMESVMWKNGLAWKNSSYS